MQRFTCKELLWFLEAKAAVLPIPPPEKAIPSSDLIPTVATTTPGDVTGSGLGLQVGKEQQE